MKLHTLPKLVRNKKRRGRGIASSGAKSGRGMKGQKSRAGYSRRLGFEGGQTPLYQRVPKRRGAKQVFASQVVKPMTLSVTTLNTFPEGSVIGPNSLREAGYLRGRRRRVKLIAGGVLDRPLTVRVHAVTDQAKASVEAAGGSVELLIDT